MKGKNGQERMQLFIEQQVNFLTSHARACATAEYGKNAVHQSLAENSESRTPARISKERSRAACS